MKLETAKAIVMLDQKIKRCEAAIDFFKPDEDIHPLDIYWGAQVKGYVLESLGVSEEVMIRELNARVRQNLIDRAHVLRAQLQGLENA